MNVPTHSVSLNRYGGKLSASVRPGVPFAATPGSMGRTGVIHAGGKEFKVTIVEPLKGNSPTSLAIRTDFLDGSGELVLYAEGDAEPSDTWRVVYCEAGSKSETPNWSDFVDDDMTGDPDENTVLGVYSGKNAFLLVDLSDSRELGVGNDTVVFALNDSGELEVTVADVDDDE